jgi:hypothetical protein
MAERRAVGQWTTTSLRIERSLLRDLKIAAVETDRTMNDLLLAGARHVLQLHRKRLAWLPAWCRDDRDQAARRPHRTRL